MEDSNLIKRVEHVTFDTFKEFAKDTSMNTHEKIGFPGTYRAGHTDAIFRDITDKLPAINSCRKKVADIGCGCDDLAKMIIARCVDNENDLYLLDSAEMLNLLNATPPCWRAAMCIKSRANSLLMTMTLSNRIAGLSTRF